MNSADGYPTSDRVMADLGDDFINHFVAAVDGARDDYSEFRKWRPSWVPSYTARFTAGFIHERMWDRLVMAIDQDAFKVIDAEPLREVRQGLLYAIRLKRHDSLNHIATYPTEGSSAFYAHSKYTLNGLEEINLALGYTWDAELREMGDAVMSFRDGKNHPVWAITLRPDAGSARGFIWDPIAPSSPEFDLSGIAADQEQKGNG